MASICFLFPTYFSFQSLFVNRFPVLFILILFIKNLYALGFKEASMMGKKGTRLYIVPLLSVCTAEEV